MDCGKLYHACRVTQFAGRRPVGVGAVSRDDVATVMPHDGRFQHRAGVRIVPTHDRRLRQRVTPCSGASRRERQSRGRDRRLRLASPSVPVTTQDNALFPSVLRYATNKRRSYTLARHCQANANDMAHFNEYAPPFAVPGSSVTANDQCGTRDAISSPIHGSVSDERWKCRRIAGNDHHRRVRVRKADRRDGVPSRIRRRWINGKTQMQSPSRSRCLHDIAVAGRRMRGSRCCLRAKLGVFKRRSAERSIVIRRKRRARDTVLMITKGFRFPLAVWRAERNGGRVPVNAPYFVERRSYRHRRAEQNRIQVIA